MFWAEGTDERIEMQESIVILNWSVRVFIFKNMLHLLQKWTSPSAIFPIQVMKLATTYNQHEDCSRWQDGHTPCMAIPANKRVTASRGRASRLTPAFLLFASAVFLIGILSMPHQVRGASAVRPGKKMPSSEGSESYRSRFRSGWVLMMQIKVGGPINLNKCECIGGKF